MLDTLVPVGRRLVRTLNWDANVVRLGLGELGQPGAELAQVEGRDLLVEVLGENVHLLLILATGLLVPQLKLSNNLEQEQNRMLDHSCISC